MKTIEKEEYIKLNKALHDLEDILECVGVKEFSLSHDKHNMQINTDTDNIDTDLLNAFCTNITQMHDARFGHKLAPAA